VNLQDAYIENLHEIILQLTKKLDNQVQFKKNKEFIKDKNIKTLFYYFRDEQNCPIVTVCLLHFPKENIFCRGLSICCPLDNINKEDGRDIAENRAIQAFQYKFDIDPIRRKHIKALLKNIIDISPEDRKILNNELIFKGQYNVELENLIEMKINN